jgi:hypothetical protein
MALFETPHVEKPALPDRVIGDLTAFFKTEPFVEILRPKGEGADPHSLAFFLKRDVLCGINEFAAPALSPQRGHDAQRFDVEPIPLNETEQSTLNSRAVLLGKRHMRGVPDKTSIPRIYPESRNNRCALRLGSGLKAGDVGHTTAHFGQLGDEA